MSGRDAMNVISPEGSEVLSASWARQNEHWQALIDQLAGSTPVRSVNPIAPQWQDPS